MKIILTSNKETIETANYSIEAGLADNKTHFDHHGKHGEYPSPCNNEAITPIDKNQDVVIAITHLDADTFVGLSRLLGFNHQENLDTDRLERMDLNGVRPEEENTDEYYFRVGLNYVMREAEFPRVTNEIKDVTYHIFEMLETDTETFCCAGIAQHYNSEYDYKNSFVCGNKTIGIWALNKSQNFDTSRPYDDGYQIAVVYREAYKTISIYASPDSTFEFAGKEYAGILFAGHPKACGSPRGETFEAIDAVRVYSAIKEEIYG